MYFRVFYHLQKFNFEVLNEEQHQEALENNYNFDHPQAFDFDMLIETLRRLKQGKRVEVHNICTY